MSIISESFIKEKLRACSELFIKEMIVEAFLSMSELLNFLEANKNEKVMFKKWTKIISELVLKRSNIELVQRNSESDFNRIKNIISVGSHFNEDELMLILTLAIQLELIQKYLEFKRIDNLNHKLTELFLEIRQLGNSQANSREYSLVIKKLKSNWGFPITSYFFD